jgi:small subunit ribosomal protein S15
MLTTRQKGTIIKKFQRHETDTGSVEVQVAVISREIDSLTKHLKDHPKDHHSRRGLLKMVSRRRRLLNFLKDESVRRYNKVIRELDLKK